MRKEEEEQDNRRITPSYISHRGSKLDVCLVKHDLVT